LAIKPEKANFHKFRFLLSVFCYRRHSQALRQRPKKFLHGELVESLNLLFCEFKETFFALQKALRLLCFGFFELIYKIVQNLPQKQICFLA